MDYLRAILMRYATLVALLIIISIGSTSGYTHEIGIETNDEVLMTYVLTVDGEIFDSSSSFKTVVNPSDIIQGFYEGLLGMKVWDTKSFVVPPDKGYSTGELAGKNLYFKVDIIEITKNVRDGGRVTIPPPDEETTTTDQAGSEYFGSGSVLDDIISSPVFKIVASLSVIFILYIKFSGGKAVVN